MKSIAFPTLLTCFVALSQGCSSSPKSFATPDEAVAALIGATRAHSADQMSAVLGPKSEDVVSSGDAVDDRRVREEFLRRYDAKHRLEGDAADGPVTLVAGDDDWPLPIPLVKDAKSGTWRFDVEGARDEIINRRIGGNELDAIQVCLAILDAQRDYAVQDRGNDVSEYAEKIFSDPGKRNGLYWEPGPGEAPSPLGELVAKAAAEGHQRSADSEPRPYHGYHYRILKAQGAHATGGARSYVLDGKMIGGFAVIAYPAEYENSGIMSFIVNHEGVVFQRDLGKETAQAAKAMTEYDPGPEWQRAETSSATTRKSP